MLFNKNLKNGFTLIEIMLVLALLGLILSFVGGRLFDTFSRGKSQAVKIQIQQLGSSLDRYKLDCGFYPTTAQGLKALKEESPAGVGKSCRDYDPNGYLNNKPSLAVDPYRAGDANNSWESKLFRYESDGLSYEVKSFGADDQEGGEGENQDISSNDIE